MIHVAEQPEPPEFDHLVRAPGRRFLSANPAPARSSDWKNREYWQKALPAMSSAYDSTCAYCAQRIAHSTGRATIDHFLPRSTNPDLAYEWTNFRYVSARFNSRKGTKSILDPFGIQNGWFILDFTTFLIKANSELPLEIQAEVERTIEILALNNDDELVAERQTWFETYTGGMPFVDFQRWCPFIASEIVRQGAVDPLQQNRAGG